MAVVLDQTRFRENVRQHLDEMRRRTAVQKGDELDHAFVAVEALAATMAAMSSDTAALIAEGERNVGVIISATMTKTALWRVVVLPAVVGALVAATIIGLSTATQSVVAQRVIQADHVAWATTVEADRAAADRRFEELRADLNKRQEAVEADKQQVEATLPTLLMKRADALAGAAREIVRQEAANPGFIDFIARSGLTAFRAAKLNAGSLCPITAYQGVTRYCEYRAE